MGNKNSSPSKISCENVAIIGGGIAGMTTAYYLSQMGVNVCVYEKNPQLARETSYGPAAVTMWNAISKRNDLDGTTNFNTGSFSNFLSFLSGSMTLLFNCW